MLHFNKNTLLMLFVLCEDSVIYLFISLTICEYCLAIHPWLSLQLSGVMKTVPENVFTSLQFGDNFIDVSLSEVPGCEQLRKPVSG